MNDQENRKASAHKNQVAVSPRIMKRQPDSTLLIYLRDFRDVRISDCSKIGIQNYLECVSECKKRKVGPYALNSFAKHFWTKEI